MLMSLGPVVFDQIANLDKTDFDKESVFAKHEVVGAAPVYEAMGDGAATFTLAGKIHPEVFGVNGALALLEAAESAQTPLSLMRGDFFPLGWVLLEKLRRSDGSLNAFGVGREIDFTVSLIRIGTPATGLARSILSLLR